MSSILLHPETIDEASPYVCRHCGSDDLASVERVIEYRRVRFIAGEDGPEIDNESWGDDDGDNGGGETIGVACMDCGAEAVPADFCSPARPATDLLILRADWRFA